MPWYGSLLEYSQVFLVMEWYKITNFADAVWWCFVDGKMWLHRHCCKIHILLINTTVRVATDLEYKFRHPIPFQGLRRRRLKEVTHVITLHREEQVKIRHFTYQVKNLPFSIQSLLWIEWGLMSRSELLWADEWWEIPYSNCDLQ